MTIALARSTQSKTAELIAAQEAAVVQTNDMIRKVREMFITPITGQEMIYTQKRSEAELYLAQDPEPATLDDYPFLAAEVGITAPTAYDLCQVWMNLNYLWGSVIGPQLEGLRMQATNGLRATTAKAQIQPILDTLASALAAFE